MRERFLHHLTHGRAQLRRAFPRSALAAIEAEVRAQEARHRGELRVALEGSLPLRAVLRGTAPRERALELFGRLGVGGTREANGVLVYLLLAEHVVEIVADRDVARRVPQAEWQRICALMEERFRRGEFVEGVVAGLRAIGAHLAEHYPGARDNPNELPDKPVLL